MFDLLPDEAVIELLFFLSGVAGVFLATCFILIGKIFKLLMSAPYIERSTNENSNNS